MNEMIHQIKEYAKKNPDSIAYIVYDAAETDMLQKSHYTVDSLTWKELNQYSDRLAGYISTHTKGRNPIIVYGHKNKYMLSCFIACAKSGHAYIPIDVSVPTSRVEDIIGSVEPEIILATEDKDFLLPIGCEYLDLMSIRNISYDGQYEIAQDLCTKPEDTFYIIFTSGSTGNPKGVKISTECLTNYVKWAQNLAGGGISQHTYRFLNQAPFSFDLSVMDIYLSLCTGGTICAVTKEIQKNLKLLYKVLSVADVNIWVSTPSFADVCLSDHCFNDKLLKNMKYFLFCGEVLTNRTVERLRENFPESVIVNTYGPTESTVCVTQAVIDEETLNDYNPLPVGAAKPGTWIFIVDENGNNMPDGEEGEIIIVGDTVSTGYYRNEEQTKKSFSIYTINGTEYRLYRTGDKGYKKNGQLFYCGRMDFQIKLHGYRIEIEDIENNLIKIPYVEKAVVLPNFDDSHRVKSLTAYLVYRENSTKIATFDFQLSQKIKRELKQLLPEYMVPKKIKFVDFIPMTMNGKVDRKALEDSQR